MGKILSGKTFGHIIYVVFGQILHMLEKILAKKIPPYKFSKCFTGIVSLLGDKIAHGAKKLGGAAMWTKD